MTSCLTLILWNAFCAQIVSWDCYIAFAARANPAAWNVGAFASHAFVTCMPHILTLVSVFTGSSEASRVDVPLHTRTCSVHAYLVFAAWVWNTRIRGIASFIAQDVDHSEVIRPYFVTGLSVSDKTIVAGAVEASNNICTCRVLAAVVNL